jgi:hypothetical protein
MDVVSRMLCAVVIAALASASLAPSGAHAETLLATKIFSGADGEEHGLAYDGATDRLYTLQRGSLTTEPLLRAYQLDGTPDGAAIELVETSGSMTKTGLHFIRAATTIGGQPVAVGSLILLRDGVLYVLDKTDGSVEASEVVNPSFDTGGLCQNPLNGGGKGLGYSTRNSVFMTTSSCCNCPGVAEFNSSQVTGFIPVPVPASGGAGDAKEHPTTGHIWVANAPGAILLSVFSQNRSLLQEFRVLDTDTLVGVFTARMAFDSTGDRLWLLDGGDVYLLGSVPTVDPIPALRPWGLFLLALLLAAGAPALAHRIRARRTA